MPSRGDEDDFLLGLGNSTAGILELSAEMLKQFGGVQGVVSKMRMAHDSEDTPANVKNQIAMFIARTMTEAAEQKGKTDYQSMSREQLVAYARKMIDNHQGTLPQSWFAKESGDGARDDGGPDSSVVDRGDGTGTGVVLVDGPLQQQGVGSEAGDSGSLLEQGHGGQTVQVVPEGELREALLVSADVTRPDEAVRG